MIEAETKTDPHFTQPVRQIMMMLVFVVVVAIGAFLSYQSLLPIFMANVYLPEWVHQSGLCVRNIRLFLASVHPGQFGQLDRRLCNGSARA